MTPLFHWNGFDVTFVDGRWLMFDGEVWVAFRLPAGEFLEVSGHYYHDEELDS